MTVSCVNTFVVGAPKCGATSLAFWLSEHPQVFFPKQKEPHYFYQPFHTQLSEDDYLELFKGVQSDHKVVAEGSVWYLFSQTAVREILNEIPTAKFIVCLRNPMEMAVSLHAQALSNKSAAYENTQSFAKAWSYSDRRFNGERIGLRGPKFDTRVLAYKQACFLGRQLKVLLEQVPHDQLHIIVMDDLKADPKTEWMKIQSFLGLQDDQRDHFEVVNPASAPKSFFLHKLLNKMAWLKQFLGINRSFNLFSGLHRKNIDNKKYDLPSKELQKEMLMIFSPEIELLEELLRRDFSSWKKIKG